MKQRVFVGLAPFSIMLTEMESVCPVENVSFSTRTDGRTDRVKWAFVACLITAFCIQPKFWKPTNKC